MMLIVPAMFGVGYAPQTGLLWVAVAFLILFGLGWGFFDCNNMPILCQIARPELRATGYGIMNFVSISCGGFADWGFGMMRDRHVPLFGIFGVFASAAVLSTLLVLLIRPRETEVARPSPGIEVLGCCRAGASAPAALTDRHSSRRAMTGSTRVALSAGT